MCRCEICKRRSRTVTIISRKVVCMICLDGLLRGVRVMVRGDRLDMVAVLSPEKDLTIEDRLPRTLPEPAVELKPTGSVSPQPVRQVDGRTRLGKEMKAAQLAAV